MIKNFRYIFSAILLFAFCSLHSQNKKFTKNVLRNPVANSKKFEKLFNLNEIGTYKKEGKYNNKVVLENGYVKSVIRNPEDWQAYNDKRIITQVDFIFTKYPKNIKFWRTNYHKLLANRVKALIALDTTLNSDAFEWNIVMQTDCNTETEAKKMFHGIAITYFMEEEYVLDGEKKIDETKHHKDEEYFSESSLKVKNYIRSQGGIGDSLIYKIFDRNPQWDNALVVMDWTGSMYRHGSQAVLWHTLNFNNSGIKNFVFFNDGDKKEDFRKQIGKTGGVYYAQAKNLNRLVNTFYLVGKRGNGGDEPENDVEALIKGMNRFEDFDEVVLIADNNSCMRDFSLISNLDVAVNIIVCGAETSINPQYVNLAYHTGGSIHTIEEDIVHLNSKIKDHEINLKNITYKLADEDLFSMKYQSKALKYRICDEYSSLKPYKHIPSLDFIEDHGGIEDSTVYKVLDRHILWDNSIVIMDFSPNMYTSSAQAILLALRYLIKQPLLAH